MRLEWVGDTAPGSRRAGAAAARGAAAWPVGARPGVGLPVRVWLPICVGYRSAPGRAAAKARPTNRTSAGFTVSGYSAIG